jgi:hypothetical protein
MMVSLAALDSVGHASMTFAKSASIGALSASTAAPAAARSSRFAFFPMFSSPAS